MGPDDGLFRSFVRDNRPLSQFLRQAFLKPALEHVQHLDAEELEKSTAALVAWIRSAYAPEPPSLGGWDVGRIDDGDHWRPTMHVGVREPVARHWLAIQVHGDPRLLEHWPDQEDSNLPVVDPFDGKTDPHARRDPSSFDPVEEMKVHRYLRAQQLWTLQLRRDEGPLALWTFIELSETEEAAVARGELDPKRELEEQRGLIEPIILAIAAQTRGFIANEFTDRIAEAIERRKHWLTARTAVRRNLTWPDGWKLAPPRLQVVDDEEPGKQSADTAHADGTKTLRISHRLRLDPATFQDVQRTIRVWADAVERYPQAFSSLPEDRLSDLLAATLNASLPGAQREVYTRGGKSDIFVTADMLSQGTGPAKIFICESKWWHGPEAAIDALAQLLGYLTDTDTAAVLLFFHKTVDPSVPPTAGTAALRAVDSFVEETDGAAGWPVLRFRPHSHEINLCVAYINLREASPAGN